jgi:protein N-terminal methyltransferase
MDWQHTRTIRQALTEYGTKTVGRTLEQIQTELNYRETPFPPNLKPYGFDHNFIVCAPPIGNNELLLVAVLQYANRRLTIRSTQPGVQLYTANYLDGSVPTLMKGSNEKERIKKTYNRWQGICLETQHFPDSIMVDDNVHPEFALGQCPILTPTSRHYRQSIEYTFENYVASSCDIMSTAGFQGTDSDGSHYSSVEEMWSAQGWNANSSITWYERAASYYEENCPTTIDGVLGGFASITELDIQGSINFIQEVEVIRPEITSWTKGTHKNPALTTGSNEQKRRACECGAGIGRVSNGILLKLGGIERCDLIESSATLLDAAPDYLGNTVAAKCRFFCTGLQDWQPTPKTYSIIWIQWVLSYLTDDDIVRFFRRCGEGLVDDGLIILKENMCGGRGSDNGTIDFEVDSDDASVTRSLRYWKFLIHQSGLRIIYEKLQDGFPDEIYPVSMLALDVDPTNLTVRSSFDN